MLNIIIIGHNERESMPKMLESLKRTFPRAKRIWVLDRCDDGSEEYIDSQGEIYIRTPNSWEGRRVSSARNLGLSFADKDADILFLDGDRYIVEGKNDFLRKKKDIVLLKVEKDERDDDKWFTKYSQVYGHIHNAFYSCGIFFKRSAVDKVLEYQGEFFDTSIEQYWGVEDVHLGDVCFNLGLTCCIHDKFRLHGQFDNSKKIPMDAWKARIRKRLTLDNIIW